MRENKAAPRPPGEGSRCGGVPGKMGSPTLPTHHRLGAQSPSGQSTNSEAILKSDTSMNKRKLSTTDLLALATMKNAAKCDK